MNTYSIIVTYYDRAIHMHNTLLSYQHYYANSDKVELLILEDKKTVTDSVEHEKLLKVLAKFKDSLNIVHKEMDFDNLTCPCSTMNHGAEIASGDYLVISNPENMIISDILNGYDEEFNQDPDAYVVPACLRVWGIPEAMMERFDDYVYDGVGRWIQHTELKQKSRNLNHATSISKKNYLDIGGFGGAKSDMRIGGADASFIKRVTQQLNVVNRNDLIVTHINHDSVLGDAKYKKIRASK